MNQEIWFVNTCGPKNVGGGETAVRLWTEEIMRRGYDVRWIYPRSADLRLDQQNQIPNSVLTTAVSMPLSRLFWFTPTPQALSDLCHLQQEIKPKAVIFNGYTDYFIPLHFLSSFGNWRSRTIQVFHGDIAGRRRLSNEIVWQILGKLRKSVICQSLKTVDAIVAVSQFVKNRLAVEGWTDRAIVCYPPTKIDTCGLTCHPQSTDREDLTATVIGRISPEKGIDFALELARASMTAELPYNFKLIGPAHQQKFLNEVSGSKPTNVSLVGARLGPELCRAYTNSSILVMPSPAEGFGLVTVEAMGHGLPVLSRGNRAAQEIFGWFGNNLPGHLSPPSIEEGVPDALQYLQAYADTPQLRTAASVNASTVGKYYDSGKQTALFADLVLH